MHTHVALTCIKTVELFRLFWYICCWKYVILFANVVSLVWDIPSDTWQIHSRKLFIIPFAFMWTILMGIVRAICSLCVCNSHICVDYSTRSFTCLDVLCVSSKVGIISFQLDTHFHPLPLQWKNFDRSRTKHLLGTRTSLFDDKANHSHVLTSKS